MKTTDLQTSSLEKIGTLVLSSGVRRQPSGIMMHVIKAFAVFTACFTVYAATLSDWDVLARTIVFLSLMLTLLFLLVGSGPNARKDVPSIVDFFLSVL